MQYRHRRNQAWDSQFAQAYVVTSSEFLLWSVGSTSMFSIPLMTRIWPWSDVSCCRKTQNYKQLQMLHWQLQNAGLQLVTNSARVWRYLHLMVVRGKEFFVGEKGLLGADVRRLRAKTHNNRKIEFVDGLALEELGNQKNRVRYKIGALLVY